MNSSTMLPPEQVKSNPMGYDTIANSSMQSDILIAADAEYSCPWSRSSSYIDSAHSMGVLCVLPPQAQQLDMSHWERPASDAHLMWQTPQVGLTPYTMDHSGYGHAYDQYRGSIVDGGTYRSMDTSPSDMKHDELMSCPMMGNPSHANHRRRRGDLPKNITDVLRMWLEENLDHPYPSNEEKQDFVQRTGLTISQVRFKLAPPILTLIDTIVFRLAIGLSTLVGGNSQQ